MRKYLALMIALLIVVAIPLYAQYYNHRSQQASGYATSGLAMTLMTSKDRYEASEPVDISALLHNDSGKSLNFQFYNTPACDFWITTQNGQEIWRYSRTRSFAGNQILNIDPNTTKSYTATWNQADSQGKAVAPGWYEVYAKFASADRGTEPLHLRVKVDDKSSSTSGTPIVISVPVSAGAIQSGDVGKSISIEGTLRQSPQGLYVDVRDVRVRR